jgi:hypothetical protein
MPPFIIILPPIASSSPLPPQSGPPYLPLTAFCITPKRKKKRKEKKSKKQKEQTTTIQTPKPNQLLQLQ